MSQRRRDFIKLFQTLSPQHRRLRVFEDFCEMAALAIRKLTVSLAEGEIIEQRYMDIVKRHEADDIRRMPELLAILHMALADGGEDFLGVTAGELELLNAKGGQFFTPWSISEMMARMTFAGEAMAENIKARGFITLCEPACGAGGMVLAFAKVMREEGFDPHQQLFVDAIDIQHMSFNMAYLQLAITGIPAIVRRGDSLAQSFGEHALTPAFFAFYNTNGEGFDSWHHDQPKYPQEPARPPAPVIPAPVPRKPGKTTQEQMTLF